MTYFGFLLRFLVLPLMIMLFLTWLDMRSARRRDLPRGLRGFSPWLVIAAHVVVAVLYTTPWDNYLVATGVWWYNPELVTGITIGWVPIEEYTFFVLQTLLMGLWFVWLARRLPTPAAVTTGAVTPGRGRWLATAALALLWLGSVAVLASGWAAGVYLGLILVWALPPVLLQVVFGGDILWRYRRLVLTALIPAVLYLAAADFLAIGSGTWTIDPAQSLNLFLGGVLPIEEFLFFLATNVLIVLGMTLVLAVESQERLNVLRRWFAARRKQVEA